MRNHRTFTAAAFATALLLTPMVSAWSSYGSFEPDTTYDTPDFMWAEPGPASADRIYFNAWSAMQAAVNANVGALETANEAPTEERHMAILGVWVDCNQDGYVGHAESALYEYRAELLLDDSVCPPVTGDGDDWIEGAHNYNGWVTELVTIGRPTDEEDGPTDARVYPDPEAKIWADQGLPDDIRIGGGTCALTPFPRGTMQSTGGLLNYLDCSNDIMEQWNAAMDTAGDPLGLKFQNEDDAQGSFADVDTFGDEHTDHAAVGIVDCGADDAVDTGESINGTGAAEPVDGALDAFEEQTGEDLGDAWELYTFKVPALDPRTLNTEDPTAPGQLNQTNEELLSDCDTSNDAGRDFYSLLFEDDWNGDGADTGKTASTWSFGYFEASRGGVTFGDTTVPEGEGAAGTDTNAFGIGLLGPQLATGWYGQGNLVKPGPNTVVVRDDLDNPGVDIDGGYYLSFYAYVGPTLTSFLQTPGGTGIYGSAQCGDSEEGVVNGWNCDPAAWNLNGDGTPIPGAELFAFVHDPYTLRDIDCYDGGNNLGVGTGLPAYGNAPCPRPA